MYFHRWLAPSGSNSELEHFHSQSPEMTQYRLSFLKSASPESTYPPRPSGLEFSVDSSRSIVECLEFSISRGILPRLADPQFGENIMLKSLRIWLSLWVLAATLLVQANAQTTTHAFLWSSKTGMRDLGTLGGSSYAYGINDAGQVVGSYASGNTMRAFLWTKSGGMKDLGTLGGDYTSASVINSAGQVIRGASKAAGDVHAFLWTAASGMQDLGTLGGTFSDAAAINDRGDMTGTSSRAGDIRYLAYLQMPGKHMLGLGSLGSQYS